MRKGVPSLGRDILEKLHVEEIAELSLSNQNTNQTTGLCEETASFPPSSLKLQPTVVRRRSFVQQTVREHSCVPDISKIWI